MSLNELESLIRDCLEEFYRRRIENLSKLSLKKVLQRKNPYLMRALGIRTAAELVEYLL